MSLLVFERRVGLLEGQVVDSLVEHEDGYVGAVLDEQILLVQPLLVGSVKCRC
jgi:hypothetical protein